MALALFAACGDKIQPGKAEAPTGLPAPKQQATATRESQPTWYPAVGTIRSRTEITVASRVTGSVESLHADAGSAVRKGQTLAKIDQRQVRARLGQAQSALAAAEAEAARAQASLERATRLHEKEAATPAQLEAAQAASKRADAEVTLATEQVRAAEVSMSYSRMTSPISGLVTERLVEVGDLAQPGHALFQLHDPQDLRLEASVREGLIGAVKDGDVVRVELTALEREVEGRIDEIVPAADPRSRSFLIKVAMAPQDGLRPGMFGRVRLSSGSREAVYAPAEAIERVGQLTTLLVRDGERWTRRYVTTGVANDGRMEILSGLDGGETIGWNP